VIKKVFQFLLGLNAASVIRGLRFGPGAFLKSTRAALGAVFPFEEQKHKQAMEAWYSIPTVALEEILGARKVAIKITVQRYEDGMLPLHEAMALLSILVAEHPAEALEIGTYMGFTSKAMAESLPDGIIHTLDLPPDFSTAAQAVATFDKDDLHLIGRRVVGREFKGQSCEAQIVQHFGDSATFDFSKTGHPTFFFIDGAHTYEYCKNDSERCLGLNGGGVFLWHDCDSSHSGVVQFVQEWRKLGRDVRRIEGTTLAYWKST
jgi:predicted O-methyltransferase YrrM